MHSPLGRERTLSLDGTWAFTLVERPELVDLGLLTGPAEGWASVEVPGCWTMQGFDRPQYTNIAMPFPGPPPAVPDTNPTGLHRRTVTVPEDWAGQRVVLHVAGAEAVLYVHVDGRPVGMGKDSRLPHEFDLTAVVEPGRPFELALTVVRWSDATYLEDQDHWYHAGLHRSVSLHATPPVHLADVHVTADWDPATADGHVHARVVVDAPSHGPRGWVVQAEVAGRSVEAPCRFEHARDEVVNFAAFVGRGAVLELEVPGVSPWSAEDPALHDLVVRLVDDAGRTVDTTTLAVGFRRVEVRGHELLVNGRAVLIKGVNRHDHDPARGKAVTPESIEHDIVLMKRHNVNAVRTSHYPNDTHLYEVCDRLGMYVVDEANVETHAYLRSLTQDPRWSTAILQRIARMAQRDKCHPSVVLWSLGNESGVAPVHQAAASWLRAYDPSRPVHYESGISADQFAAMVAGDVPDRPAILATERAESDVIAPMYPPVEDLRAWATRGGAPDRPLIMCEYIHAMNNSCGGLDDYWEAIRAHPGLQGGFVWDWVDQALVQVLDDGTTRLAYGGDFGDRPNDGPFCLNGLVAADRTPHPALLELAKVVQPLQLRVLDAARSVVEATSELAFADCSWLAPDWSVHVDGESVAAGSLAPLDVGPGATTRVEVPVPPLDLAPGSRAHLTVSFRTTDDLAWAPAGHLVAWEQVELGRGAGPTSAPGRRDGQRSIDALEPRLALWRAPIDNETFGPRHAARWEQLGLRDLETELPLRTTTAGDGDVTHEVTVPAHLDDLPRVGVRLRLGAGVHEVEWLGVGPHECYVDRRASGRFGRWRTLVDEWPTPYVHPQASGNRVGVRWLRFLDADGGTVLTIDRLDDLQVTVARTTEEEVWRASHLEDLPVRDECFVWIDAAHRGVGSGAVGPDVAPRHRIGPGRRTWSYRLG